MEEKKKLYSKVAIAIGAYFGGPLVAGILIRRNYLNLGRKKEGLTSLVIGIVSTILMLWLIPESAIDKISGPLIFLVNSVLAYFVVEIIQGDALKQHKEDKKEFYSIFGVIGGVFIFGLILAIVGIVFLYFIPEDWYTETPDTQSWNVEIYDSIQSNDSEALKLFDKFDWDSRHELDQNSKYEVVRFIEQTGIPKLKENIEIINNMSDIDNLPEEYQKYNKMYLEYSKLRIETYELLSKAISNETSKYDEEIDKRHIRINEIIHEINTTYGYTGSPLNEPSYDNVTIGKDEFILTLEKYRIIKTGMSYEEVINIIGFEIEPTTEIGEEGTMFHTLTYTYYGDIVRGDDAIVVLTFSGGTLGAKTQEGLE